MQPSPPKNLEEELPSQVLQPSATSTERDRAITSLAYLVVFGKHVHPDDFLPADDAELGVSHAG